MREKKKGGKRERIVVTGPVPTPQKIAQDIAQEISRMHTVRSVRKLIGNIKNPPKHELAELAMTGRGRRLVIQALQEVYRERLRELDALIEGLFPLGRS